MPAFYRATVAHFLCSSETELLGILSTAYAKEGFVNQKARQTLTWLADTRALRDSLQSASQISSRINTWSVLLEFNIPRKEKRLDVVLLASDRIILLELKSSDTQSQHRLQLEEYALLLHYFHSTSRQRHIHPFLISPTNKHIHSRQQELEFIETPAFWISPVEAIGWAELANALLQILTSSAPAPTINHRDWEHGSYHPVPSIIEAALALQQGLQVREIAHSQAARHDIDQVTSVLMQHVEQTRAQGGFAICFVTGVPGSGKTLVGLNLAYTRQQQQEPIHFMSGNGPLVKVLQTVLARHRMQQGVRSLDARLHAKTLIENVHVFAKEYAEKDTDRPPSNHVVIFDEAQRAWDRLQNMRKFKRNYSEPEMLLKIMERHTDWAVIIALVGGGQEINTGEAGLAEWGRALAASAKPWRVFASPEVINGGTSVAGSSLLSDPETQNACALEIHPDQQLHLKVSVRNLRADRFAAWVNYVLEGDAAAARDLNVTDDFPLFLVRTMEEMRYLLRRHALGQSRSGLVASSSAARLRADGLEPSSAFHAEYPWEHWYLAPPTDVRSSYQHEVFATEFEIQGLELDWVGLCWGGDFIWSEQQQTWMIRSFCQRPVSFWSMVRGEARQSFRRNAYRVLLTRARQGLVLYVPRGEASDPTRSPTDFDQTAAFLLQCGVKSMNPNKEAENPKMSAQPVLI